MPASAQAEADASRARRAEKLEGAAEPEPEPPEQPQPHPDPHAEPATAPGFAQRQWGQTLGSGVPFEKPDCPVCGSLCEQNHGPPKTALQAAQQRLAWAKLASPSLCPPGAHGGGCLDLDVLASVSERVPGGVAPWWEAWGVTPRASVLQAAAAAAAPEPDTKGQLELRDDPAGDSEAVLTGRGTATVTMTRVPDDYHSLVGLREVTLASLTVVRSRA